MYFDSYYLALVVPTRIHLTYVASALTAHPPFPESPPQKFVFF